MEDSRRSTLEDLFALRRPLAAVRTQLAEHPWDSKQELVTLLPVHVVGVLDRFAAGEITAADVEAWAEAIECREDVALANEVVAQALFRLANPLINEPITLASAARMVAVLKSAAT